MDFGDTGFESQEESQKNGRIVVFFTSHQSPKVLLSNQTPADDVPYRPSSAREVNRRLAVELCELIEHLVYRRNVTRGGITETSKFEHKRKKYVLKKHT